MWWDKHLLYRKQLVKYHAFDQDKEEFEDVLDDIEVEKEERKERKRLRAQREAEGEKYIDMLRK